MDARIGPLIAVSLTAGLLAAAAPQAAGARAPSLLGGPLAAQGEDCADRAQAPPPLPPPTQPNATITPRTSSLRLAHGRSTTRTYTLTRPASPTPVDVYFLVDTTGSMGAAICGVQAGLVDIALGLHDEGIDARFGIGEFRDYPQDPWGSSGDFAYRRQRIIGPLDQPLIRAVQRLKADGGGDGLESALAGLYQAATGEGQDVAPEGASRMDIPRGQAAGFRDDALRVIVNVTDVQFRKPTANNGYPGPSWKKVVAALRARGIRQVGISVDGGGRDLAPMARDTDALTPAGGVDCDDDGRIDLQPGEPLTCTMRSPTLTDPVLGTPTLHLAPAIVAMVRAIKDEASISHAARARYAVRSITPVVSPTIDLKKPAETRFRVRYVCGDHPGTETVRLTSSVRGEVIARATTRVRCDPAPVTPAIVAPVAAAAGPPQTPAQQIQPQANPQAQVNQAVQPNVGVVPQQQEQLQTALSRAFDETPDLAMSASRATPTPLAAALALAAASIAGAAVFAFRTEIRPASIDRKDPR